MLAGVLLLAASAPGAPAQSPPSGDPMPHLERFVELSQPPEYRRFGSPGMTASAEHAAAALDAAGYTVVRLDVPLERWAPDYDPARSPRLERLDDGAPFVADAVFRTTAVTPPEGITCTVRALAEVGPGDCGFVPFDQASPEWNNVTARAAAAFDEILAAGGIGAVVQGDPERGARFALSVRRPLPGVVAVVDPADVVGRQVRLRVVGGPETAIAHEVIGIRRPTVPGARSLLLQGHLDGWYQAAVDNAAGAAAVLAAAERLASVPLDGGLVVALHDAEEWGLAGSEAFAAALSGPSGLDVGDCGPALQLADLAAVINLDASSARASDLEGPVEDVTGVDVPLFQWRVLVFSEEPVLGARFVATMTSHQVLGLPLPVSAANPLNGGMDRTDGRWFHAAGIPVVWPVAGYPEYHTDVDTLAAVDPADLAALTDATVELVTAADDLAIGPVAGSTGPVRFGTQLADGCGVAAPTTTAASGGAASSVPDARADDLARTGAPLSLLAGGGLALLGLAAASRRALRSSPAPGSRGRGTPGSRGRPSPSGSARRP